MTLRFKLILALVFCLTASGMAAPNLYVNGSLLEPIFDVSYGWGQNPPGSVNFTLLYEETPYADCNTFFLHQAWDLADPTDVIFSASDGVGTSKSIFITSEFSGFSLLSDLNGNGLFDEQTESWVNSNKDLNLPNPPGSTYQFLRPYVHSGYAHYYFEEGGLEFWGDYEALLFIDDGPVTGGADYDHNDMIIGINQNMIPEPSTLIMFGLGALGLLAIRIFRN